MAEPRTDDSDDGAPLEAAPVSEARRDDFYVSMFEGLAYKRVKEEPGVKVEAVEHFLQDHEDGGDSQEEANKGDWLDDTRAPEKRVSKKEMFGLACGRVKEIVPQLQGKGKKIGKAIYKFLKYCASANLWFQKQSKTETPPSP